MPAAARRGRWHHRASGGLIADRRRSLFVPRDFDISPYFQVVKPTLTDDFDYKTLVWARRGSRQAGVERAVPAIDADRQAR